MNPHHYITRDDQHTWLKKNGQERDVSASAILRVFVDLGIAMVASGAVNLDSELTQREGKGTGP